MGAVISGGLVALALPNLIDVSGASGIAKAILIAGGATLATYSVNRFAIDKGTELASRGFITASIASVLSMTFVGMAFFASTFAGLTLPDVEKLRLQEHGNAYIQYIGERNLQASKAGRTLPVMRSINRDLPAKASCEIREACISGRGKGGRGTIAKILEGLAGRAAAISEQLETGEATRQSTLKQLNKLVGEYQSVLGQSDKTIWERRGDLQKIDAKINQIIATLDEAIPLALLRAYASELNDGVSISERPVASRRLNALLKKHGNSLGSVLATLELGNQIRPSFPARTGVGDTFSYISHFAPIALLTAGIELVWPICLWIYTLLFLRWGTFIAGSQVTQSTSKNRMRRKNAPRQNRKSPPHNRDRKNHLNGKDHHAD
ncbi:MAG: hypothetical protein GY748_23710 [Planctomycetaceae bacterium]|nr:hypothetical protein [Planctomycetaceae bacterium]